MTRHTHEPLNVTTIIGSTRAGRFGPTVADWINRRAAARDDFAVDVLDLAEIDLPAVFPSDADRPAALVDRIRRADGYIVVTPEYNHSFPAALKQAIDIASAEWRGKPVGFVSYGGLSGGLRAVEQLRLVFAEVHAVGLRDTVSFHNYWDLLDEHGELGDRSNTAATVMLDQLAWWAEPLRAARRRTLAA